MKSFVALALLAAAASAVPLGSSTTSTCANASTWSSGVYYIDPDKSFRTQISSGLPCPAGNKQIKVSLVDAKTCATVSSSEFTLSGLSASVATIDYEKNIFVTHGSATTNGAAITLACPSLNSTQFGATATFKSNKYVLNQIWDTTVPIFELL